MKKKVIHAFIIALCFSLTTCSFQAHAGVVQSLLDFASSLGQSASDPAVMAEYNRQVNLGLIDPSATSQLLKAGKAGAAMYVGAKAFETLKDHPTAQVGVAGATIGATIGSIVPGIGTIAGGIVGGLCGAVWSFFSDD